MSIAVRPRFWKLIHKLFRYSLWYIQSFPIISEKPANQWNCTCEFSLHANQARSAVAVLLKVMTRHSYGMRDLEKQI